MKRLIVNADDFGRSTGINLGIVRAQREGIVTSTTLMTNAPGTAHAATLAATTPGLAIGVHLVLTYARPLLNPARIRSLVREGEALMTENRSDLTLVKFSEADKCASNGDGWTSDGESRSDMPGVRTKPARNIR